MTLNKPDMHSWGGIWKCWELSEKSQELGCHTSSPFQGCHILIILLVSTSFQMWWGPLTQWSTNLSYSRNSIHIISLPTNLESSLMKSGINGPIINFKQIHYVVTFKLLLIHILFPAWVIELDWLNTLPYTFKSIFSLLLSKS